MSLLLSHLLLCLSLLILFSHIFHPILSNFCPTLCLFVFPSCLLFFSLSDCSRPVLSFLSLISFSSHLSSVFFFLLIVLFWMLTTIVFYSSVSCLFFVSSSCLSLVSSRLVSHVSCLISSHVHLVSFPLFSVLSLLFTSTAVLSSLLSSLVSSDVPFCLSYSSLLSILSSSAHFFPSGLSSDSPAGNLVVFMLFIRSLYGDRVIQCMCTVCHWPNNWPKCVINHLCDNDSNQDNSRPELHNQSVYTLTFTQKHFNQCLTDPGSHIRSLKVYIHRSRDASHN